MSLPSSTRSLIRNVVLESLEIAESDARSLFSPGSTPAASTPRSGNSVASSAKNLIQSFVLDVLTVGGQDAEDLLASAPGSGRSTASSRDARRLWDPFAGSRGDSLPEQGGVIDDAIREIEDAGDLSGSARTWIEGVVLETIVCAQALMNESPVSSTTSSRHHSASTTGSGRHFQMHLVPESGVAVQRLQLDTDGSEHATALGAERSARGRELNAGAEKPTPRGRNGENSGCTSASESDSGLEAQSARAGNELPGSHDDKENENSKAFLRSQDASETSPPDEVSGSARSLLQAIVRETLACAGEAAARLPMDETDSHRSESADQQPCRKHSVQVEARQDNSSHEDESAGRHESGASESDRDEKRHTPRTIRTAMQAEVSGPTDAADHESPSVAAAPPSRRIEHTQGPPADTADTSLAASDDNQTESGGRHASDACAVDLVRHYHDQDDRWPLDLERLRRDLSRPPSRDHSISSSARGLVCSIVAESLSCAEQVLSELTPESRPGSRASSLRGVSEGSRPASRGLSESARSFVQRVVRQTLDTAADVDLDIVAGAESGGVVHFEAGLTRSARVLVEDIVCEAMSCAGMVWSTASDDSSERWSVAEVASRPNSRGAGSREVGCRGGESGMTDSARLLVRTVVSEMLQHAGLACDVVDGDTDAGQEQPEADDIATHDVERAEEGEDEREDGGLLDGLQPDGLEESVFGDEDADESEEMWVYRLADHLCTKHALHSTVSPVRLADFQTMTQAAALEPIEFHRRRWDDEDEEEADFLTALESPEHDFGTFDDHGSDDGPTARNPFACEGEIGVGEVPRVFEFEVDPVAKGFVVLAEGCCGRVTVQCLFNAQGDKEEQESPETKTKREADELQLKREYREAARRAKAMTVKREQGFKEAQEEADMLYDRIVNAAKKHPPQTHIELPYLRRAVEMSVSARNIKRREGKLPWGPTVTEPIDLQGTSFGGLWSLTFEAGGHGPQPFTFRAAALSIPPDPDGGEGKQNATAVPVLSSGGTKRVLEGHKFTSQELETMGWTKENKVAMSRYHASAYDGRKTGAEEEGAARRIQKVWVENAAERRTRASERMRRRMFESLEEGDKKLLGLFLLKDNYDEIDDFRKAQRLTRALKYGVPFEEYAILELSVSAFLRVCARRRADRPPSSGVGRLDDIVEQLADMKTHVTRHVLEDALRETATTAKPRTPQSVGSGGSGGSAEGRRGGARAIGVDELTRAAQKIIQDISEAAATAKQNKTPQIPQSKAHPALDACRKSGPDAISALSQEQIDNRLEALRLRLQFRSEEKEQTRLSLGEKGP